jgi:presequence protease
LVKQNRFKKLFSAIVFFTFAISLFSGFGFARKEDSLTIGQTYYGFKLTSQKFMDEIQSKVLIFTHIKSGAKLIFLQNEDDNKVFSIAFKTPADNNTGVNHIIEHSVLDGSSNYPVKSPFLEIGKRSLSTFLNAYTAADRTVYPVASRNEKDFNNLMGIYLDAVFYPNVLKDKRIFLQEAGHYDLASSDSDLNYKGVVYNEMRGDLSSPSSLLTKEITESLFPDTQYRYNSGGAPEEIPNLTWLKLKDTYNKNYHPSNSFIYLYGNIKIKPTLQFINNKYLNKFTIKKVNNILAMQKPFKKPRVLITNYPIDKSANPAKKAFLSLNFVIDKFTNKDTSVAFMFLNYLLLGNNGSPLKSALLHNSIGSNVYGKVNLDGLQTTYSIIAENADVNQRFKFQKIILDTLNNLIKHGMNNSNVSALIHSYEISFKAGRLDANRGLNYNNMVITSWTYGGDPLMYLSFDSSIKKIKNSVSNGYFQSLISKYLINNKLCSLVALKPVPGLAEKTAAETKAKLKRIKSILSAKDIQNLIKQSVSLREWQSTPNSKQALLTLPSLAITDIDKKAELVPMKVKSVNGVKLLTHSLFTNKIIYSDMYFDTTGIPQGKLPYLYLLSSLLGELNTQNYGYMQLIDKVNGCLGDLRFAPYAITKYNDLNTYFPKLDVSFYTLASDLPEAFDTINEIINSTKFDNLPLIKQYIKRIRSSMDNNIVDAGIQIVDSRLQSYYSEFGRYNDMSLLPYYNFITDLDNNFGIRSNEIKKNLKEVSSIVFNKKNMTASVTCDSDLYATYAKNFNAYTHKLGSSDVKPERYKFNSTVRNEGYMSTSQVQYIAKGYDINRLGYRYSGKMEVLSNIINGAYIWNKVRELGGAYGGAFRISSTGKAEFISWRDPNLKETMDIFNKSGEFIKYYALSDKDLTDYIISTIGGLDKPMSPSEKGKTSDLCFFSGLTQAIIQNQRDEILSTTVQDIKSFGDMLSKITAQNEFCIFGSKTKIMDNKGIFNKIINVGNN